MGKKSKPQKVDDFRSRHVCDEHVIAEEDHLHAVIPGSSRWRRYRRWFRSLFLVSTHNYRSWDYFKSREAINRERGRHLRMYFHMIHPFSIFRVYWEIVVMIGLLISLYAIPLLAAFSELSPKGSAITMGVAVLNIVMMIDVALLFITGRTKVDTKEVILKPTAVAMNYTKGRLGYDVLGTAPLFQVLHYLLHADTALKDDLIQWPPFWVLRQFSLVRFLMYYSNFFQAFRLSYVKERIIRLVILVTVLLHTAACVQYSFLLWVDKSTGKPIGAKTWIGALNTKKMPDFDEYVRSVYRIATLSTGVCSSILDESDMEQGISLVLLVVGNIMSFILIANAVHMIKSHEVSSEKYQDLRTHLEQFLAYKKLPKQLRKKAQDFYDFRYHKSFYNEGEIMNTISDTLRQDIILFKCKKLLDGVKFFRGLPGDLKKTLVKCMRNSFYQPGDMIIKLHDTDSCMYFIKTGTVAIYTSKDKEICHLEDGNHFGEISLMLDGVKRVSSVVAIENCELYKMERVDFVGAMESYPEIMASMRKVALARLNQTMTMTVENTRDDSVF